MFWRIKSLLPRVRSEVDVDGWWCHLTHATVVHEGGECLGVHAGVCDRRRAHVSLALTTKGEALVLLVHFWQLLGQDARRDSRTVRRATAVLGGQLRIRDAEVSKTRADALVENILRPLHGGVAMLGMGLIKAVLRNQVW